MKLSRQYRKPLSAIAKANNIPPQTMVKVGDRIVIPGVRATQAAAAKPPAPVRRSAARSLSPAAEASPPQPAQRAPRRPARHG